MITVENRSHLQRRYVEPVRCRSLGSQRRARGDHGRIRAGLVLPFSSSDSLRSPYMNHITGLPGVHLILSGFSRVSRFIRSPGPSVQWVPRTVPRTVQDARSRSQGSPGPSRGRSPVLGHSEGIRPHCNSPGVARPPGRLRAGVWGPPFPRRHPRGQNAHAGWRAQGVTGRRRLDAGGPSPGCPCGGRGATVEGPGARR